MHPINLRGRVYPSVALTAFCDKYHPACYVGQKRSRAIARIADYTAKNCRVT